MSELPCILIHIVVYRIKKEVTQLQYKRAEKHEYSSEVGELNRTNRLLFGVDSVIPANVLLQNNLELFEWVRRNKNYPAFWGRNILGEGALTQDEIAYLRESTCKIAPFCMVVGVMETALQGLVLGAKAVLKARELGISEGTAIYMQIDTMQKVTTDYLQGYATVLLSEGYIPGFKANTDANYDFDREFSRGLQVDRETFSKCLLWATAPIVPEYEGITTTHLFHPNEWKPFAPSGTTRSDIAIWQYGRDCHPIPDDSNNMTVFNVNLIHNVREMIKYMY